MLGKTTTPFAIKGGGHAFNAGHSSTTGVLIATSRLDGVAYDPKTHSVTLGMGGICEFISLALSFISCWFTNGFMLGSNVYTILQAQGLTVSGGRVHGVGVGGYLLGGGFSHLTGDVSVLLV